MKISGGIFIKALDKREKFVIIKIASNKNYRIGGAGWNKDSAVNERRSLWNFIRWNS